MGRMNAYDILGIASVASSDEIKRAYFKLAKRYHPDVCKEPDALARMKNINLAYQAIQDGRGRFWSPPIEQKEPDKPQLPPLEEMIAFANSHDVEDEYLIMIIVGGRDQYSKMSLEELEERLGPAIVRRVVSGLGYQSPHKAKRLVGTALRWHMRGLKIELAIRKATADDTFYREEARKARA